MNRLEILQDIASFSNKNNINPEKIILIAVSKNAAVSDIYDLYNQGQRHFAENIIQNALLKQEELKSQKYNCNKYIIWHFIAPVQSNKTKDIADNFSWVHSLSRLKIALRLNNARDPNLPPLNVCLQVNIDGDENKSGIRVINNKDNKLDVSELKNLVNQILELPNLRLRGLMTLPKKLDDKSQSLEHAKKVFSECQDIFNIIKKDINKNINKNININKDYFDTLSMGMSEDYHQAILSGSNMIRVGRKLFE